jgi:hypothetical protein
MLRSSAGSAGKENVFGEHSQPGKPEKDLHHFAEPDFWLGV